MHYIIVAGNGKTISDEYLTREEAEFDFPSYAKLFSGCRIKEVVK